MVKARKQQSMPAMDHDPFHMGVLSGLHIARKMKHKNKKLARKNAANGLKGMKGGKFSFKKMLAVLAGPIGWYHLAKNRAQEKQAKNAQPPSSSASLEGKGYIAAPKKRGGGRKPKEIIDENDYGDDDDDDDDEDIGDIMGREQEEEEEDEGDMGDSYYSLE